jgi:hypothetical protein
MGLSEKFRESFGVVIGAVLNGCGKVAPHNHASVAVFLEEKETGGSLHIGERLWRRFLEQVEPAAARNGEAKISHEFFMVLLANSQKIKDVFIEVIQQLHFRWLLMKEHLRPATEWFTVTGVLRDERDDFAGDAIFTA